MRTLTRPHQNQTEVITMKKLKRLKQTVALAAVISAIIVIAGCATEPTPTTPPAATPPPTTSPPQTPAPAPKPTTPEVPPDEHQESTDEHGEALAPEEIHELIEEAVTAVKSRGDVDAAVEALETAGTTVTEPEVKEKIEHIITELRENNLQEAVHTMEDWLGAHEEAPDDHSQILAPEEVHDLIEEALAAIENDDIAHAIEHMREAMEVLPDGEVKELIEHTIQELEEGNIQDAKHEMEDMVGMGEH